MKNGFYALKLTGICVAVFIVQYLIFGFTEMFLLDSSSWIQPWRFITSIFLHGGIAHLLYNMFALALFGSVLEGVVGSKRFLGIFFFTGLVANLISVNFYSSALGASGAIMGIIGALIMLRPKMTVWTYSLPMPLFIAGFLWAGGDIIGVLNPSGVGNIAHLSGIFFGLIIGFYYRKYFSVSAQKKNLVILDENSVRRWEDEYLR